MSTPLDPPPHDSTGSHTPAPAAGSSPGPPGPRRTTSPALIIAGVALGLLVLGALLVWLVSSLVAGIGATLDSRGEPAGPDRPVTTATGGPGGEPSPRAPVTTPASRPAPMTPEATAVAGATVLRAPEDGALLSAEGTFPDMVLDEKSANAVRLPDHDGPLLVVWSNSSHGDRGTFFLTGYERAGGDITEALGIVRNGRTGMQLIDMGSGGARTRVLYPKGNQGVSWRVDVFPLSALPSVERGQRITGAGPAVLRLPAGRAGEYRLSVKDEGVPRIEVHDADELGRSTQFEYGTAPVDLDVSVGSGEQVIQLEADDEWLLEPR